MCFRKKIILVAFSLTFSVHTAHAIERNSTTNKFVWGDDLSQTDTVNGTGQTSYPATIKASHLSDIKQAIDISKTACNVVVDVWAGQNTQVISQIGYPSTALPSTHVNVLRRAIEALYTAKSNPNIANYFTGSVNPGDRISKSDINNMRRALDDLSVTCAGGARTPVCWTLSGPECDIYAQPGCSNAKRCGIYSYSDGSTETDTFPCDAPLNAPPPGWTECGGGASYCWENASGPSECVMNGACSNPGQLRLTKCRELNGAGTNYVMTDYTVQCNDASFATCTTPVVGAVCGNGTVESGEQCDDSNTANGDGCSSTCQTESCQPDGTPCGTVILSINGSTATGSCNTTCCSGTAYPTGGGQVLTLLCGTMPAVCGNGAVETGEQCDDSNTANGDGCSSTCQTEAASSCSWQINTGYPWCGPPPALTCPSSGASCTNGETCIASASWEAELYQFGGPCQGFGEAYSVLENICVCS